MELEVGAAGLMLVVEVLPEVVLVLVGIVEEIGGALWVVPVVSLVVLV